jgi:hypothetical protein
MSNFLPQTFIIPEDPDQKDLMLRNYLGSIATATNTKDSGIYSSVETITGQKFLPTFSTDTFSSANYKSVIRKVFSTGALPNSSSITIAHGITFSPTYSVTRMYGAATNPSNSWIPLPYASPTLADNISLEANSTNIIITTGSNRTAYTISYVVIEFATTL